MCKPECYGRKGIYPECNECPYANICGEPIGDGHDDY